MVRIVPHSNGEDASPLHEFNPCHAPDTGQFCSGGKVSAGRAPSEYTPSGAKITERVDILSSGGIRIVLRAGSLDMGIIGLGKVTRGKLALVENARLRSEMRGRGWGVWLYKRATELAMAHGASGVWSPGSARNPNSDRVWASMERKGLAERLESKGGRDIYRMPPAGGIKKLREYNSCHSPDDGKFCSGEKTPGGTDRAAKVQRQKDLLEEIRPLAQKRGGGLTASEAAVFERKMLELEGLRFDLAKPFDGSKVRSAEERMSTLSVETIGAARGDLLRNKDIYLAIAQGAIGVHYSKTTAIDDIMDGKNPKVSAEAFYENFAATRDALRAQYGDTITLYRATGKQIAKATQNWATTFEFAAQFGPNVVKRKVPVDAVIALNVSANGLYHELIVNAKVIREARFREFNSCHSPKDGKFCSGSKSGMSSPGFQTWFKGSKVVDGKGNPLVVYHGGRAGIQEFRITNDQYRTGMFFSSSEKTAGSFAKWNKGEVYPVYLSIKKPFVVDAKGESYFDIPMPKKMRRDWVGDKVDADGVAAWALKNGYDGAIIRNVFEGTLNTDYGDNYVVFSPKQIRRTQRAS